MNQNSKNRKRKKDWKESANVEDYSEDSNVYYTQEVHEKVCEYVHNDDLNAYQRKKIYENYIYDAFDEMVKIMINTYKFYYTGVEMSALIQEVNVKMYEVLETSRKKEKYYDESYGSSYSYFSRVAKNYLIQKQRKHQDNKKKYGMDSINDDESYYIQTFYEEIDDVDLSEFIDFLTEWLKNNIDVILDKEEDKKVGWGIIDVMERQVEINNKKLFYYMIKEQYGDDDYRINKVLNIFKEYYDDIKNEYLKKYYVNTDRIE